MQAAGAAWMQPDDPLPDGFELSEEAAAAANERGTDFGQLYVGARERLAETMAKVESNDGDVVVVREDDCRRICRFEVALAAELTDEGTPLQVAMQAVEAASATENEQMINATFSHYDSELEEALDEEWLTPLAAALEGLLFTRDPDGAGL